MEFDTGRVVASVNVPLADVPPRRVLEERLGVPVFVDNDATVAAFAEAHDDELSIVSRNLVTLTVGTGVGGGLILGGRIYRGATGGAGELGHTFIGANLVDAVPAPVPLPATQDRSSVWLRDTRLTDSLRASPPPIRARRSGDGELRTSPCLAPMWCGAHAQATQWPHA